MNWFLFSLGVIAAFAVILLAVLLTLIVYFRIMAKRPARKLGVEIGLAVFVVSISLIVRLIVVVVALDGNASLGVGIGEFLKNLFYSIGGLTFNGDFAPVANGTLACFYYGVILYVGLVFLAAITAKVNYEFYSHLQLKGKWFKKYVYYVFTAVTNESLVLAASIKEHHDKEDGLGCKIIFFENGENSFSRKNPLYRRLMEQGFLYFSNPRRSNKLKSDDKVCFFDWLKLSRRHFKKVDSGRYHDKLFYVFAVNDSGDYENANAASVFGDMESLLRKYVSVAAPTADNDEFAIINNLPTVPNYFLLTGGEINYESYLREQRAIIEDVTSCGNDKTLKGICAILKLNVFNEATLSSYDMLYERGKHLLKRGEGSFLKEAKPCDKDGVYRVAVIGFGKTGQYAMEELYIHTAYVDDKHKPSQYIADVYDEKIDEKSGLFAYNHPLFRCICDEEGGEKAVGLLSSEEIIKRAKTVKGNAFDILYRECKEKTGKEFDEKKDDSPAQMFVEERMSFPIVCMHAKKCFEYPFMDKDRTEAFIRSAKQNKVRAFVIALGNDERNVAMANVLIDGYRRSLLNDRLYGKKETTDVPVTIYVNLIEERSKRLLNWRQICGNKDAEYPELSVIPFGCRTKMYSYDTLLEDYYDRIYNYAYNKLYSIADDTMKGKTDAAKKTQEEYDQFCQNLMKDVTYYKKEGKETNDVIDLWMKVPQYEMLSNKSALTFAVNYYQYLERLEKPLADYGTNAGDDAKWEEFERIEHERWDRFYISHGWIYARKTDKEVKQHSCLCPFDEMLENSTKNYDRGNVLLGFIKEIAISKYKNK